MIRASLTALALTSTSALAQSCPPAPDHSERLAQLIAEAQSAPTEMDGRLASNKMWDLWADAPDETAQEILDSGLRKRRAFDLLGARADFDRLIDYCPDYAEGYNQRAFVNFIRQDYEIALQDLDRALNRSPNHVAALAGKALTLIGLKRQDEAQTVLRQALSLNPWLAERQFLTEPDGQEL
ncbi:tetratricopeptide repeat protein [Primorskyibacter flagellatus]|uniref:tetratricopeptide repeat protein n=1 Tax=Primorskyibacter flagellatus TaxID=1387277 RepID=UPI003A90D94F